MGHRQRGFTLIELMIVVLIIAVVAAIALPNLLSARLTSNETTAIGTLRALISAQSQFQMQAAADIDQDGIGEYGVFAELTGAVAVRGGVVVNTPVFGSTFRTLNATGEVAKHGYQYRIFLPSAAGTGLGEVAGGGPPAGIDTDLAEGAWCAYAWPSSYEVTGTRTFFVNQAGELIFTVSSTYTGPGAPIVPGAAMAAGGMNTSITGTLATGSTGRDGFLWRAVQG